MFKLYLGLGLVLIFLLKNSFQEKNVKTNILGNTPLIFLNLEKRNILLVLRTEISKLDDNENIYMAVKIL